MDGLGENNTPQFCGYPVSSNAACRRFSANGRKPVQMQNGDKTSHGEPCGSTETEFLRYAVVPSRHSEISKDVKPREWCAKAVEVNSNQNTEENKTLVFLNCVVTACYIIAKREEYPSRSRIAAMPIRL